MNYRHQYNIIFGLVVLVQIALGQPSGQEIKWMRVGNLHNYFSNLGAEMEMGRTGAAEQQLDGLRWPAQYKYQDCVAAKSMWIGTTDYYDPVYETTFPYKVVGVGTRGADAINEIMPYEFKMMGKFDHPLVVVDGGVATDNYYDDIVDDVDSDLIADRVIISKMHTSIGLSITRKIYAFSQQYNDNYFIYEYTFKNTGIIDLNGTVVEKTLTDVIPHFQYRYALGHEAFVKGWVPSNNVNWGRNVVNHVVGPHIPNDDSSVEFRAQYSWYGRHSQSPVGCEGDLGCPNYTRGGALGAPQFVGTVTIHADASTVDHTDDIMQPFNTKYLGSDTENESTDQYNRVVMEKYYERMSFGHPALTHAQEIADRCADNWGADAGGFSQAAGYGPYDFEPGDSIRIVIAEGVAGIDRQKSINVGDTWFNQSGGQLSLPGGGSTTDRHVYKDAWLETGVDSLYRTFRTAITTYSNGMSIPHPPQPPSAFEVNSGGDRILLSWKGANAESALDFDGYQIYRAMSKSDTTFKMIFECNKSNLVHEFADITALRGFDYYYYIVSKDNGTDNVVNPGTSLVSSKFYTMTNKPAFLRRPAGEAFSELRIVPNPYSISSPQLQFGNGASERIAFYGLPGQCIIRIFTEAGDLIETIHHTDGSGDELWNSTTSSRQIIVSGVYIIHFEVTENLYNSGELLYSKGDATYRKFIVVR